MVVGEGSKALSLDGPAGHGKAFGFTRSARSTISQAEYVFYFTFIKDYFDCCVENRRRRASKNPCQKSTEEVSMRDADV